MDDESGVVVWRWRGKQGSEVEREYLLLHHKPHNEWRPPTGPIGDRGLLGTALHALEYETGIDVSPSDLLEAEEKDSQVTKDIEYSVKKAVKRVTFFVLDANNRSDAALELIKARIVRNGGKEFDNAGWFTLEVISAFTRTYVGNKEALRPAIDEAIRHVDHYLTHGAFPYSNTGPSDSQQKKSSKKHSSQSNSTSEPSTSKLDSRWQNPFDVLSGADDD